MRQPIVKHYKNHRIDRPAPTATVSMAKKINMGNYESVDLFVSVSGVRAGMTPAEIAPLLTTAKIAWDQVKAALIEQVKTARTESRA